MKDGGAPNYTRSEALATGPALADAEPKKQTESANAQERPAPKAPAADATKDNPPKGGSPKEPKK